MFLLKIKSNMKNLRHSFFTEEGDNKNLSGMVELKFISMRLLTFLNNQIDFSV